jgi:hypothetical protein
MNTPNVMELMIVVIIRTKIPTCVVSKTFVVCLIFPLFLFYIFLLSFCVFYIIIIKFILSGITFMIICYGVMHSDVEYDCGKVLKKYSSQWPSMSNQKNFTESNIDNVQYACIQYSETY